MINEWLFFLPGGLLGALLCVLLAMLGVWLRPRQEAVAAFSYAQVAVLGAMLAVLLHLPALLGAWLLAGVAGLALLGLGRLATTRDRNRHAVESGHGGQSQLILLVGAWALGLLLADNHPEAMLLSMSAIEGQLLLIRWHDWPGFLLLAAIGIALLALSGRRWLAGELLPWAPARPDWRPAAGRELAIVSLLAAGALGLGVFVTLALIVLPAWVVWDRVQGWRRALWQAGLIGLAAHGVAFVLALLLDQVYSAMLIVVLALMAGAWRLLTRP